jgi:hypothetical protein
MVGGDSKSGQYIEGCRGRAGEMFVSLCGEFK